MNKKRINSVKVRFELRQFIKSVLKKYGTKIKVMDGHYTLIEQIAYLIAKNYSTGIDNNTGKDEWIPLFTNNQRLATLCNCNEKTVYNRLSRFEGYGLIRKDFKGRQRDYVLWIPKWILLAEPCPEVFLEKIKPHNHFNTGLFKEILPPRDTRTIHNNIVESSVDLSINVSYKIDKGILVSQENQEQPMNIARTQEASQGRELSHKVVLAMQEQVPAQACPKIGSQLQKKLYKGYFQDVDQQATRSKQPEQAKKENYQLATEFTSVSSGIAPKKYLNHVCSFWDYVKSTFYSSYLFNEQEERKIKNLIYKSVFGDFKGGWSDYKWKIYYQQCIERINIAKNYIERFPYRFIPHPKKYFDNSFEYGFHGTYAWLQKRQILKNQVKNRLELQKAQNSLKIGKLPKGFKTTYELTRLQLFHYWQNHLKKLKDEQVMQAFYSYCSTN